MSNRWIKTKIGNLATLRKEKFNPKTKEVEKYVGLEHIEQGTGRLNGYGYSSETTSMKSIFEKGDILFGKLRPYLRKYWYAQFRGVCATEILPLVANKDIDKKLLFYLLQQDRFIDFLDQKSFGTKMPRTSWNEIKEYECSIPSLLVEQQKIVAILSSIDNAIEKTVAIIKQTEEVKKGLMQQLLTKGIGHTKFKKTEIGEIPESWQVIKFKDITEVLKCGVASTPTYVEEGIPFLSAQNVKEGKVSLEKYKFVSEEYHKELTKKVKPRRGDILYTRVGAGIGKAAVVDFDMEFSVYVSLTLIRMKQGLNEHFYQYLLNSPFYKKQATMNQFAGAGVPNLNVKVVEQFPMVVPPLKEQNKIVDILSTIDSKIDSEKKRLNQLKLTKKGLMQSLLTGKVRVEVDEIEVMQV